MKGNGEETLFFPSLPAQSELLESPKAARNVQKPAGRPVPLKAELGRTKSHPGLGLAQAGFRRKTRDRIPAIY
jgi:hypothetical protein